MKCLFKVEGSPAEGLGMVIVGVFLTDRQPSRTKVLNSCVDQGLRMFGQPKAGCFS
jgi:hypothetical protein